MSEMQLFDFDPAENVGVIRYPQTGQSLRWVRIDGVVWLHFADLCKGTGHTNPSSAIFLVEDEDKRKIDMRSISAGRDTLSNLRAGDEPLFSAANARSNPEAWFVNEDGFTTLGLAGRGDGPKVFRRWVVKVVLPQFRQAQRIVTRGDLARMVLAEEAARELAERERDEARAVLAIAQPKVEVYDEWLTSESIEMTDFSKRIEFTPPAKFTATLRGMGILRKDKTRKGHYRNLPTKEWEDEFDVLPTRLPNGVWIDQALIKPTGQLRILEAMRAAGHEV